MKKRDVKTSSKEDAIFVESWIHQALLCVLFYVLVLEELPERWMSMGEFSEVMALADEVALIEAIEALAQKPRIEFGGLSFAALDRDPIIWQGEEYLLFVGEVQEYAMPRYHLDGYGYYVIKRGVALWYDTPRPGSQNRRWGPLAFEAVNDLNNGILAEPCRGYAIKNQDTESVIIVFVAPKAHMPKQSTESSRLVQLIREGNVPE